MFTDERGQSFCQPRYRCKSFYLMITTPAARELPVDFGAGSPDTAWILLMQKIPITFLVVLAAALIGPVALAQTDAAPSPAPAATAAVTPAAGPTPLSLAERTTQIVIDEEERGKIEAELKALATPPDASTLSREVDARLTESARLLASGPSIDTIRELEARWQNLSEALTSSKRILNERVKWYEEKVKSLDKLQSSWTRFGEDKATPRELCDRMDALVAAAKKNRATVQKRLGELALILSPVEKQERQVNEMIASVKKARPQAVSRLFVTESVPVWNIPLWSAPARTGEGLDLAKESREAWAKQWNSLTAYATSHSATFLIHALFFAMLLSVLYWARRRVRVWSDDEPKLKRASTVFEVPLSMAIAFSLLATHWIYPDLPHLLKAIVGAAALVPAILILRRLVDRHLFPILNALVVFYFIDQLRMVATALPIADRLLFLAEMAGGILFLAWLLRSKQLEVLSTQNELLSKATMTGVRLALAIFSVAFVANMIGCVNLGNLLGNAALKSTYLAVVLYATSRVADGMILGGLSTAPLSDLGMVKRYRTLIWHRTHRVFEAAAFLLWTAGTLDMLTYRKPLVEGIQALLLVNHKVGDDWRVDLTLSGQVLAFAVVVWAAFLISRFIRFVMEEDFYPRMHVERGLSYAVSTMLHYVVLLLGFYVAASTAGIDMTKFTILAGAFGVGMGFGLQNIINNFVSGVILLFERPIKVGDVVQMSDASGVVDHIGIRASIIRTGSGSEIIVPNGKLISDQVINWTFSNRRRSFEIPVSVPYGIDPCRVIEILTRIAKAHELVSVKPPPNTLLTELGSDKMEFKLSAWTDHIDQWAQIRSDLAIAINAEFVIEGIHHANTVAPVHP